MFVNLHNDHQSKKKKKSANCPIATIYVTYVINDRNTSRIVSFSVSVHLCNTPIKKMSAVRCSADSGSSAADFGT